MRAITPTMEAAASITHGHKPLTKVEIYPSLTTFSALTRDNAVPGADSAPAGDNPMDQELSFNVLTGVVTWYSDGDLNYALDGDANNVSTIYFSSTKPGIYGSKIFVQESTSVKRYSINWSAVQAKNNNPLTLEATLTPTNTILATHGLSDTECVVLGSDDGGISISYFNGTTETLCPVRFIFPLSVDWDDSSRTLISLAKFSTAFILNGKIYIYISNASSGMVQGIFYDPNTETWSDIYNVLQTDLDVSLCEFRIANSFVRNGKAYISGNLIRTDIYQGTQPHSLILSTEDGRYCSIDRFSFVSNMGYRFFAITGNNNLYLGNCNRICEAPLTWVFNGNDDSTSPYSTFLMEDIHSTRFSGEGLSLTLKAGDEAIFSDTNVKEGSRVKLFTGLGTSVGEEYILFGTYIIRDSEKVFANGERGYRASCEHESTWKLTGLSMPFYAEILGLSSLFDPMNADSGKLYGGQSSITDTSFWIDFWDHVGYANSSESITAITFITGGGVDALNLDTAHKSGIITNREIKYIIGSLENPKITATSIDVAIYGWSHPYSTGNNDIINLILIIEDEDGNESTVITTGTKKWKQTYPAQVTGEDPITYNIAGLTVDTYIKKVGLVFEAANGTVSSPGRVEFLNNIEVAMVVSSSTAPWKRNDDGTFEVPEAGQPFIMFSQQPYDAWNFFLTALFENTVAGGIDGYPVAVGLVGLAEDSINYIVARYDKVSNRAQLVKSRNGIETVITWATPGWALGDINGMQFSHKEGHFEIKLYNESTLKYQTVLTYDWGSADGFLYTSRTVAKKCGIWGGVMVPSVRILSYDGSGSEESIVADGIVIDPLSDLADFPDSGQLSIEGSIYSYSEKIFPSSYIPGPHQLRNTGTYQGAGHGLECLLFDWYGGITQYADKFVSLDNGKNFVISSELWRIQWEGQWRYNRSRHYSANQNITGSSATIATKVFVGAGGFGGISLISGTPERYSTRTRALLQLTGSIKCYWFMGAGGQHDTTIADLIQNTCTLCGTRATFPGNFITSSLAVSGLTTIYQDLYSEGYDVSFDLAAPESFELRSNVKLVPDNYDNKAAIENDTGTKLVFTYVSGNTFEIAFVSTPSDTVMYTFSYTSGNQQQHFRVLYYSDNISIYHNHQWVASIATDGLDYTQSSVTIFSAYHATSMNMLNVSVSDLSDWREAVYIDLETDGSSAISSIVQERPIEIYPNPDGTVSFFYTLDRDDVTLLSDIVSHRHVTSIPEQSASDAIVYGLKDVKTIVYGLFANTFGFSTKLFRLPNLDVGAVEAAYRMLIKSYERKDMHKIVGRPDFRIVPEDMLTFSYIVSGTQTYVTETIIVEDVSFDISQRGGTINSEMIVTGRGVLA